MIQDEAFRAYHRALKSYIDLQMNRLAETADIWKETSASAALVNAQLFQLPPDEQYLREYRKQRKALDRFGDEFPFPALRQRFGLSEFEADTLLLAYFNYTKPVDLTYAMNLTKTHTLLRIRPDFLHSLNNTLFRFFLEHAPGGVNPHTPLVLRKRIYLYLSGVEVSYPPHLKLSEAITDEEPVYESCDLQRLLAAVSGEGKKLIYLSGETGTGRKTAVKRAAYAQGRKVLFIDLGLLKECPAGKLWDEVEYFIRECILENALPCFCNTEGVLSVSSYKIFVRDILTLTLREADTVFLIQETYTPIEMDGIPAFHFPVCMPDRRQRAALWSRYRGGSTSFLANAFVLSPGQIEKAAQETALLSSQPEDGKTLSMCCYHQTVSRLRELADKIPVSLGWDDLIVPPELKKTLREACNHVKYADIVLEQWNLKNRAGYGVGVNILLAGPPGTGKTMAAQVVAGELNMELYRIDTSKLVSKYIGETEKRLKIVFDEGKKSNVVLFFDEMDSLFGNRTEIKDSHDKYANMQTSYILQRVEEYEGVILLATNLLHNIDEAFIRRLQYVLHFPIPNAEYRRILWRSMLPAEAPVSEDIDFDFLADNFELCGGVIKNIVVSAAFFAAGSRTDISMRHMMNALQIELSKQGKVLIGEDLGPYSHYFLGI